MTFDCYLMINAMNVLLVNHTYQISFLVTINYSRSKISQSKLKEPELW